MGIVQLCVLINGVTDGWVWYNCTLSLSLSPSLITITIKIDFGFSRFRKDFSFRGNTGLQIIITAVRETGISRHNGGKLEAIHEPIVLWRFEDFQEVFSFGHIWLKAYLTGILQHFKFNFEILKFGFKTRRKNP